MKKSSLWIRTGKQKIQIYRVIYGEKKHKICSIKTDLSDASNVENLLENELEKRQWSEWFNQSLNLKKSQKMQKYIDYGIDNVLLDAAEALKILASEDPRGEKSENRELAANIWGAWSEIYKTVGSKNAWCMQQKESLKMLKYRTKKDE